MATIKTLQREARVTFALKKRASVSLSLSLASCIVFALCELTSQLTFTFHYSLSLSHSLCLFTLPHVLHVKFFFFFSSTLHATHCATLAMSSCSLLCLRLSLSLLLSLSLCPESAFVTLRSLFLSGSLQAPLLMWASAAAAALAVSPFHSIHGSLMAKWQLVQSLTQS